MALTKPTIVTGINKFALAVMTQDDTNGQAWNTPQLFSGIQEFKITPKYDQGKLYGENRLLDVNQAFLEAQLDWMRASFTSAERAVAFGQTIHSLGGAYQSASDQPPVVAVLYRCTLPGGAYRYGVLYKCMFMPYDADYKSQQGKIEYAQIKPAGIAYAPANNTAWWYEVDSTDPNYPASIDTTWFNSVQTISSDTAAPTIASSVPAAGATSIAVNSTYVWTFSEAIIPACVTNQNFFLMKDSDQSIVAATLTQSADLKTITLTPTANLSNGNSVYFAVAMQGVKDLAGNALSTTPVIRKFTTIT